MSPTGRRARIGLVSSALILGVAIAAAMAVPSIAAGGSIANHGITIVNLSDQSFSVAWTTSSAATGSSLEYGASCATANNVVAEQPSNGYGHLVNAPGGLMAGTTYYFKLKVNGTVDSNQGKCFTAKTYGAQTVPPPPTTAYGYVKGAGCTGGKAGNLVMVVVSLKGKPSASLATITGINGLWTAPIGAATNASGQFLNVTSGAAVQIRVVGTSANTRGGSVSVKSGSPVTLAKSVCVA